MNRMEDALTTHCVPTFRPSFSTKIWPLQSAVWSFHVGPVHDTVSKDAIQWSSTSGDKSRHSFLGNGARNGPPISAPRWLQKLSPSSYGSSAPTLEKFKAKAKGLKNVALQ